MGDMGAGSGMLVVETILNREFSVA
jgi:hypothetical protein